MSPGYWIPSIINGIRLEPWGPSAALRRGKIMSKNWIASLSSPFLRKCSPRTNDFVRPSSGGISNQRLWPAILVFQAEVPRGSIWTSEPERLGPIKNHRCGGALSSPSYQNVKVKVKTYKFNEVVLLTEFDWFIFFEHLFCFWVILKCRFKHIKWRIISSKHSILNIFLQCYLKLSSGVAFSNLEQRGPKSLNKSLSWNHS